MRMQYKLWRIFYAWQADPKYEISPNSVRPHSNMLVVTGRRTIYEKILRGGFIFDTGAAKMKSPDERREK